MLRAYHGIDRLLTKLTAAGRTLGIITSKSGPTVGLAFAVLPLRHHFSVVIAAEDTEHTSPIPRRSVWRSSGWEPISRGPVTSGDAPFDIQAAQAAGRRGDRCDMGVFARDVLEELAPDAIVDTIDELTAVLLGR